MRRERDERGRRPIFSNCEYAFFADLSARGCRGGILTVRSGNQERKKAERKGMEEKRKRDRNISFKALGVGG